MAQLAVHSSKIAPTLQRFLGEANYYTTPFVGQMDAKIELGLDGQRGDSIGDIAQRTTHNGRISPRTCAYPQEVVRKKPVENYTQATERDRKVRNQQLKSTWQNNYKKD